MDPIERPKITGLNLKLRPLDTSPSFDPGEWSPQNLPSDTRIRLYAMQNKLATLARDQNEKLSKKYGLNHFDDNNVYDNRRRSTLSDDSNATCVDDSLDNEFSFEQHTKIYMNSSSSSTSPQLNQPDFNDILGLISTPLNSPSKRIANNLLASPAEDDVWSAFKHVVDSVFLFLRSVKLSTGDWFYGIVAGILVIILGIYLEKKMVSFF